jgi:hypothetical protein
MFDWNDFLKVNQGCSFSEIRLSCQLSPVRRENSHLAEELFYWDIFESGVSYVVSC